MDNLIRELTTLEDKQLMGLRFCGEALQSYTIEIQKVWASEILILKLLNSAVCLQPTIDVDFFDFISAYTFI